MRASARSRSAAAPRSDRPTRRREPSTSPFPAARARRSGSPAIRWAAALVFLRGKYGLACDSLVSVEMVDAAGRVLTADAGNNADLFWACRGAGGGSFGVVTRFVFKCQSVKQATVFGVGWQLPPARARAVMKAWQSWAPNAPNEITSILRIAKSGSGTRGAALRRPVDGLGGEDRGRAAAAAGGGGAERGLDEMHDDVPRRRQALHAGRRAGLHEGQVGLRRRADERRRHRHPAGRPRRLPANAITIICDAYGGAIADVAAADTAFPHRQRRALQHAVLRADAGCLGRRPSRANARLYAAMRPLRVGSGLFELLRPRPHGRGPGLLGEQPAPGSSR